MFSVLLQELEIGWWTWQPLSALVGIHTPVWAVKIYCIPLQFKHVCPLTQQFHFYEPFLQKYFQSSQRYVDKDVYLQDYKRKKLEIT